MIYLVDTNVLLRSIQTGHPMHADASRAVELLIDQGHELSVVAQSLIEFWAVATRPTSNNGLALSHPETSAHLETFKLSFTLLPETPDIFSEWERLVALHLVSGRQSHDARLVAAMLVHDVTHLLTFNTDDFKRYTEITAVNPSSL
jgi:predicted nucleic acid-binding protein